MKKKRIIAILMIVFGIILIGGAFILGKDNAAGSNEVNNGEDNKENDKDQEGVYYDPSSSESIQINLLEKMQKLEYKYKDFVFKSIYIFANPGVNVFDGIFIYNGKTDLVNYKFVCILYDKNNKEVYRFNTESDILKPGDENIIRAETMTYLGDVVRFEIKEV